MDFREVKPKNTQLAPADRPLAEKFIQRVIKHIKPETDPEIMRNILHNLRLDSFKTSENLHLDEFLIKIQKVSMNMQFFIKNIKEKFLENRVFCQLFASIEKHHLINDKELQTFQITLQVQLNLLCLFEAIIVTLMNSPTLAKDLYQHICSHRLISSGNTYINFLIAPSLYAGFFPRIKLASVEPVWTSFMYHQTMKDSKETPDNLQKFVQEFKLKGPNASLIRSIKVGDNDCAAVSCWALNVSEAIHADKHIHNAYSGSGWIGGLEKQENPSYWGIEKKLFFLKESSWKAMVLTH